MCRRKPLPRCYGHAATAHQSAWRRFAAADQSYRAMKNADLGSAPPPSVLKRAKERLQVAADNAERATLDFDSTPRRQEELKEALAGKLSDKDREALERRMVRGAALREARRRQAAALPPPPEPQAAASPKVGGAYSTLVGCREQMAYVDARLAAADGKERERLLAQRSVLEDDTLAADVDYRLHRDRSAPDTRYLAADENAAARSADPLTQREVAYVSHLRAAYSDSDAGHSRRFGDYVVARSERMRASLNVDDQPRSAGADSPASRGSADSTGRAPKPAGASPNRGRARSRGRGQFARSVRRTAQKAGAVADKVQEEVEQVWVEE